MITVLCGGVGAAKFLQGLLMVRSPADVAAIINTGDDAVMHGLHVSPDIDTIVYTLSGEVNPETGWGRRSETWEAMRTLRQLERQPGDLAWFNLGDKDIGTHLYRTSRLREGAALSEITAEIAAGYGVEIRMLPMSDSRVATMMRLAGGAVAQEAGNAGANTAAGESLKEAGEAGDGNHILGKRMGTRHGANSAAGESLGEAGEAGDGKSEEIGFQEYFVKLRHDVEVAGVRFDGAEAALPAPGVAEAIAEAEILVLAPSNPVVSLGPPLAVKGIRSAILNRIAHGRPVAAISPLIAGRALKGPADRLLTEMGGEASSAGIARWYEGLIDTLVIDEADAADKAAVEACGVRCVVTRTVMDTPEIAQSLAQTVLDLV